MKKSDLNPPCQNCTERHSLCHSDCERYKQYKENRRSFNRWQHEYAVIEGMSATRSKRIEKDAKRRQDEKRRRKGRNNMIAFLGGFFLGGVFGIIAMAFAIAAKENKEGK